MTSTRKGFMFKKISSPIQTEIVSFDEIENDSRPIEVNSKNGREVSPTKPVQEAKKQRLNDDNDHQSQASTSKSLSSIQPSTIPSISSKNASTSLKATKTSINEQRSPPPPNSILPKSLENAIIFSKLTTAAASAKKDMASSGTKPTSTTSISSKQHQPERPSSTLKNSNADKSSRDEAKTSRILDNIIPKSNNTVEAKRDPIPAKLPEERRHSLPANLPRTTSSTASQKPSSSQSPPATAIEDTRNPNKSYYPKISYRIPSNIISSIKTSNHATITKKFMDDIYKTERAGLQQYFKSSSQHHANDKNDLEHDILDVLSSIKDEVDDMIPDDVIFMPEVSHHERELLEKMVERIAELEKYEESIKEYDSNIELLGKDFNIWISSVPEADLIKIDPIISDSTADVVSRYGTLLEDIETHCEAILKESDSVRQEITIGKKSQETLFKTYTEMGSEEPDTKAVLKQYRHFM